MNDHTTVATPLSFEARLDRLAGLIARLIRQQQAPTEELVAALREVPKIGEPCGA